MGAGLGASGGIAGMMLGAGLGNAAGGYLNSLIWGDDYTLKDATKDFAWGAGTTLAGGLAGKALGRVFAKTRAVQWVEQNMVRHLPAKLRGQYKCPPSQTPSKPARFITTGSGVTIDRLTVSTKMSVQRQGRHVLGAKQYANGSYFTAADDAQRVLDAFHDGSAQVLGIKGSDIVVKVLSVTGYNVNRRAGFPKQPTHVCSLSKVRNLRVSLHTIRLWKP